MFVLYLIKHQSAEDNHSTNWCSELSYEVAQLRGEHLYVKCSMRGKTQSVYFGDEIDRIIFYFINILYYFLDLKVKKYISYVTDMRYYLKGFRLSNIY